MTYFSFTDVIAPLLQYWMEKANVTRADHFRI